MAGKWVPLSLQYRYYARYRADRCIRGHGCKLTELLSVSQNYCLADVSVFDWYQYVLGILGGWMAGVYGGFTSSAEFIDGARGISSHFILFTHS
jgi:hypothetical protein